MDYILFIHSSIYGHLGCFHLLVTVNNAARDMSVHISESLLLLLLEVYPEVGLLEHMVTPCLISFEELPYSFPQHDYLFTFPPTMRTGSDFSSSSPIFLILLFGSSSPKEWSCHLHFKSAHPRGTPQIW